MFKTISISLIAITLLSFVSSPKTEKHKHWYVPDVRSEWWNFVHEKALHEEPAPPVFVINSVPYFVEAVRDRTAGGKLNYSNGLVCTSGCMAFNNVFTRLPGSLSLKSEVFASSPCTCGNSIRCENAQFKNGVDSTERNMFYSGSFYFQNYYSPRDNQNELFFQLKNVYQASNNPNISIWNRPLGASWTKMDLILEVDTLHANQSDPVQTIINLDTLRANVWTDIVVEVKWAANYTGYVKVYLNGVLRITYNGATKDKAYDPAHERIPNAFWGNYKFSYCGSPGTINTVSKTQFVDVIRVGNSNTVASDYFIPSTPAPQPPVAKTYNNPVITNPTSSAVLNATSTTPAGVITSKQWTQIGGTTATIVSPNADTTNITGMTTPGTRTFKYKVTNTAGLSDSAFAAISVNAEPPTPNLPPVVDAGEKRTLAYQDTIHLEGSATDADGAVFSYLWKQLPNDTINISTPTSPTTTVTGLAPGTYLFSLSATDNDGDTGTNTVEITILPRPKRSDRLRVRRGY